MIKSNVPPSKSQECQLQINISGAWKTVVLFDSGRDQALEKIQQGATLMHQVNAKSSWRIATCEGRSPAVLSHMGPSTYGIWIDALRN